MKNTNLKKVNSEVSVKQRYLTFVHVSVVNIAIVRMSEKFLRKNETS